MEKPVGTEEERQGEQLTFARLIRGHTFTICNDDCIRGMIEHVPKGTVDVVVTSPPYNLGVEYGRYNDTAPRGEYLKWIGSWGGTVKDVLSENGSLFLNIGSKPSDPWVPFDVLSQMRQHFHLQNVIHWVKSIAIDAENVGRETGVTRNISVGHYKPINSQRFINDCHEYVFHLTKHGDVELDRLAIGVEYQDKSNISRWNTSKGDLRCRGNTWFVPYKTIQDRDRDRPHPATFPVAIPKMCILLHGLGRARLVMDPFLGIGHAALACLELDVDFVGFEIDPDYYAEACRALELGTTTVAGSKSGHASQLSLFAEESQS